MENKLTSAMLVGLQLGSKHLPTAAAKILKVENDIVGAAPSSTSDPAK